MHRVAQSAKRVVLIQIGHFISVRLIEPVQSLSLYECLGGPPEPWLTIMKSFFLSGCAHAL